MAGVLLRRLPTKQEEVSIIDACKNGDVGSLKMLHEVIGVDVAHLRHYHIKTSFERNGERKVVDRSEDRNNSESRDYSSLFAAVSFGSVDVVRYLIEAVGCDVESRDDGQYTPLMHAAFHGHVAVLEYLLKVGCSVDLADASGTTALIVGSIPGHVDVAKKLIEAGCNKEAAEHDLGGTALCVAAYYGHTELLKYLIGAGCNASVRELTQCTPLMMAAHEGQLAVVEHLIKIGCDINAADRDGHTALTCAVHQNHDSVTLCLITAGSNLDTRDADGCTPLHKAACNGNLTLVELLVSRGCNTANKDNSGCTPAFAALLKRQFEVVQFLLGDHHYKNIPFAGVRRNRMVCNDLGRLITCNDSQTLPDGSVLNFIDELIHCIKLNDDSYEQNYSDGEALISLACVLCDGATVTLDHGLVLNNRQCLAECLYHAVWDPKYWEALLRLGCLLRDPLETVLVRSQFRDDRLLNGQQCFVEIAESSSAPSDRKATALYCLGCRLKSDETVSINNDILHRRECFERAAAFTPSACK